MSCVVSKSRFCVLFSISMQSNSDFCPMRSIMGRETGQKVKYADSFFSTEFKIESYIIIIIYEMMMMLLRL